MEPSVNSTPRPQTLMQCQLAFVTLETGLLSFVDSYQDARRSGTKLGLCKNCMHNAMVGDVRLRTHVDAQTWPQAVSLTIEDKCSAMAQARATESLVLCIDSQV